MIKQKNLCIRTQLIRQEEFSKIRDACSQKKEKKVRERERRQREKKKSAQKNLAYFLIDKCLL